MFYHLILIISVLLAQVATAYKSKAPPMDPAVREAYISAYYSALREHHTRAASPALATASAASIQPASTTTDPEVAEDIVRHFLLNLIWYTFLGFLLWSFFGVVRWRQWAQDLGEWFEQAGLGLLEQVRDAIYWLVALPFRLIFISVRAIARGDLARLTTQAIRDRLRRLNLYLEERIIQLRFNWVTDTIYLYYQLIINWFGHHKWQLIAIFAFLWYVSNIIDRQINKTDVKFMK